MGYNLGPVKPHVRAAAEEIGGKFGIKRIGGWRPTDPFPDHPSGRALDIMTSDKSKGDAIAQYAIENHARLAVDYIIWWHRIWQRGKWGAYTGTSNPHTDHVHITFFAKPGKDGPVVDSGSDTDTDSGDGVLSKLGALADIVSDPKRWKRLGLLVLGAALFVTGALLVFRSSGAVDLVPGVVTKGITK